MALDRTWYNTLADDSGAGTDGSSWDKGDVDSLMDAFDAYLVDVTSPAYNSSFFTGSGTLVWTVSAGDMAAYSYVKIGKKLTVVFAIVATTVSGTGSELRIFIPNGYVPAIDSQVVCRIIDNNVAALGMAYAATGASYVRIYKDLTGGGANWSASTDLTYVYVQMDIFTTT